MSNITGFLLINIYAFLLILATTIVFFSKQRLKQVEDETYKFFLITNIFISLSGLILGLAVVPSAGINEIIIIILNKFYLCFLILWISILTFYYIYICLKNKTQVGKYRRLFSIITMICIVLIVILPITVDVSDEGAVAGGPAILFTYSMFGLGFIVQILCVIRNYKKWRNKKWIPLYLLIFLGTLVVICMVFNPSLNYIINPIFIFIAIVMYHTIENPDVRITAELYKNKKLIEKSNQDTSNFLFRMTQDIKKPVKDIIDVSLKLQDYTDFKEAKKGIKYINNMALELDYLINDALDVSNMTTKRLKIFDSRYNSVNIFKEISYRFEKQIDKDVKFNFNISSVLPSYLYGDSIKLKQAINCILDNALKHTDAGEIDLDVNGIVKYGICRLMITISDTGRGMDIEDVNDILSLSGDALSDIDLHSRDGENLNLKEVKKLISLLGGNLMVKSEENVGTTVSIVLEQKIVESKETEISKKLESYEQSLYSNKKVMVVDDDAKELAQITTWLENHEADVSGSLFGRDAIEKIASNIKYDLIILDDETSTYSALDVLKELKKNKKFNTPVVVMIDDNKEFIKLHYLQDGFADCIMKSKLESEINRIMKRF